MSKIKETTNNDNKDFSPNLDLISACNEAHLLKLKKARKLIGNVIHKDGRDFGRIVEIITIGEKIVAVTKTYQQNPHQPNQQIFDSSYMIDVASIFRILARNNGSEKHYPDGSGYSRRVMSTPRTKGKGHALTGKTSIDEEKIDHYERHFKNGGKK